MHTGLQLDGVSDGQCTEHASETMVLQRVVLKFGGTSIGKYPVQVAKIIS